MDHFTFFIIVVMALFLVFIWLRFYRKWTDFSDKIDSIEQIIVHKKRVKLKTKLLVITKNGIFVQLEQGTEMFIRGNIHNMLCVETIDGLIETKISNEFLELIEEG